MKQTISELAADLMPFILQSLGVVSGPVPFGNTAGALLQDGSRPLLASLSVAPLATIDGVDISAIPGYTVSATGLGLSGGGAIGGNPVITLTSLSNPGVAAAILASGTDGHLFLRQASFGNTAIKPHGGDGLFATQGYFAPATYTPSATDFAYKVSVRSDTNKHAMSVIAVKNVTVNSTVVSRGLYIAPSIVISSGVVDSGQYVGIYSESIRQGGAGDAGTLTNLWGNITYVGHWTNIAATAVTTNVYGQDTVIYRRGGGSMGTVYGYRITESISGPATPITNYFSIYSVPADARMYHAGRVSIGSDQNVVRLAVYDSSGVDQIRAGYSGTVYAGIKTDSTGAVTLTAAGSTPRFLIDHPVSTSTYTSQLSGLMTNYLTGAVDARYIYSDEMHVKLFIADLEQALAGGQIISKSVTVLHTAFTAPAAGDTALLVVKDLPSAPGMAVFQNGDFVAPKTMGRAGGGVTVGWCWGTVVLDTSYGTGGFLNSNGVRSQRYTFTRSANPNAGAMAAGTVIQPDAIILDFGTPGNGIWEVTAIDGLNGVNSPYARAATFSTHPSQLTEHFRGGKLTGITTQANEFGLFAGNWGASNAYVRISNSSAIINNIPLWLTSGNNPKIKLEAAPFPFMALGDTPPTAPLTSASTTGLWAGMVSATDFRFRLGTTVNDVLTAGIYWNGSSLTIAGNGSGITNIDGSNITTGTVTLDRLQAFERSDNLVYNSDFRVLRMGALNTNWQLGAAPDGYQPYNNAGVSGVQEWINGDIADAPNATVCYLIRFTNATTSTMGMMAMIGRSSSKSDFRWVEGATYLISFYARCWDPASYGGTVGLTASLYWNINPTDVGGATWISNPGLAAGWQRYVARVTWGASTESSDGLFINFGPVGGAPKSGDLMFAGMQIERCKATDTVPSPYRSNSDRQRGNGLITAAHSTIQATGLYATADHLSFIEMSGGTPYYRAGITNGGYFYLRGAPTAPASFVDFDPATGKFRGGRYGGAGYTSPTIEWETDSNSGAIFAGGGRVRLGAAGMSLVSNVGYNAEHAIKWYDNSGTTLISSLYSFMEASTSGSFGTWLYANSNNTRKLSTLVASYNNVGGAQSALQATYIVSTNWSSLISAESVSTGSTIDLIAKNNTNSARIMLKAPAAGGEFIDYYAIGGHFFREGQISLSPMTPPATPNFGRVYLYVDSADNKLKAKGSSGTVTILANP